MKIYHFLSDLLGQKSKVAALRYFVNVKDEISIRELSRAIKITQPNLSRVLKELEKAGVLTSRKFGTSLVFRLNREHYLVNTIISPLFKKEKETLNEIAEFLIKRIKFKYLSLILFGSVVKKTESASSDLDIAIVVPDNEDADKIETMVLNINPDFISRFGNMLSPVIIKKSELIARNKKKESLIVNIIKEGKILNGQLISELLKK